MTELTDKERIDRLERQCEALMSYSETHEENLLKLADYLDIIRHHLSEWTEFMTISTCKHEIEAHKFEKLSSAKRIRESIEDIDGKYHGLFHDLQEHFKAHSIPYSKKKSEGRYNKYSSS